MTAPTPDPLSPRDRAEPAAQPDAAPDGPPVAHAPIPLTGAQYRIRAGDYAATVTGLGAGLRLLTFAGQPLIAGYEPDQAVPAGAGQLLIPWPNRVDDGRYEFGGKAHQLDLSEVANGNAIHGLTRWAKWEPTEHSGDQVTLTHLLCCRPGYPFCLELSVTYRLMAEHGLDVSVTALNVGSRTAPYGTGSHPYLTAGTPLINECALELGASHWLPTDERGIPSAPPREVSASHYDFRSPESLEVRRLDHALTGLARDDHGRAWARLTRRAARDPGASSGSGEASGEGIRGVGLWAGPGYPWLQVFTGDTLSPDQRRRALAVEPMTCPPNAFVTGQDLLALAPAESVTHRWGIQALPS